MQRLLWTLSLFLLTTACAAGNDSPIQVAFITVPETDPTQQECNPTTLVGITRSEAKAADIGAVSLVTFYFQSDAQDPSFGFEATNASGPGQNSFIINQVDYRYDSSLNLPSETRALNFLIPANADPTKTCIQELILGDAALNTLATTLVTEPTLVVSHIQFKGNFLSQTTDSGASNTVDFPFTLLPN